MNKRQINDMLRRRICQCVSMEHACETVVDFKARMRKEASNARIQ